MGQILNLRGLVGTNQSIEEKIIDIESYIKTDIYENRDIFKEGDVRPFFDKFIQQDSKEKDSARNLNIQKAINYFYKAKGIIIDLMQDLIETLQNHNNPVNYEDITKKLNEVLKTSITVNIEEIKKIKLKIKNNVAFAILEEKGEISVEHKEKMLKQLRRYNDSL